MECQSLSTIKDPIMCQQMLVLEVLRIIPVIDFKSENMKPNHSMEISFFLFSSQSEIISLVVVYLATLIQIEIALNGVPKLINNFMMSEGNSVIKIDITLDMENE
ncbi:CLUMA_CG001272, isoform A [Clunio marinus]|uniref:CLUMA_CG001272, isoform A n=1 Tax=Clunio marinus TaxID=568069 RepID=A0A1J1HHH0_9DIPT|nr:CLUMA_CG001272, isoform A [Clunio marinus]